MRTFTIILLCLIVSCAPHVFVNQCATYKSEFDIVKSEKELDVVMASLMAAENIPGAAISIVKREKVLLAKAYGVRSASTADPVTTETVFEFASLSKPVFALAVLKLARQGIIELDKPLCEYLDKPNAAHDDKYKLITANMVLCHTTGFPNWARGKPIELAFTPGERFHYSGEGYHYLQQVVESLTKLSLQEVVSQLVFIPLGMSKSSYIWKDQFDTNKADGHSETGAVVRQVRKRLSGNSASSLITNVNDYMKFVSHILSEYRKGNPLIQKMVHRQVDVKDYGNWGKLYWGLGWGIEQTLEGHNFWQWGNNSEFRSLVVANLENGIGFLYVANSANGLKPIKKIIQHSVGGIHPLVRYGKVR